MSTTTPHIQLERDGRVQLIRIHRPEKRNALTQPMYRAMAQALAEAAQDDAVRVVLLTGTSEAFTAGNDLGDFLAHPPDPQLSDPEESPVVRFLHALVHFPKPLVAAVNGVAVGIGTTMLLHCDLVYAGEDARFHLPFVDLGLVPEAGSSYLLPTTLGQRRAAELLLLAEPFGPAQAQELGIVNQVLPPGEVEPVARERAQTLARKAPMALRLTKQLMRRAVLDALEEAMAVEMYHFAAQLQGPEAAEALQAFFERRRPDFSRF